MADGLRRHRPPGYITRARAAQVMNLLHLAPDIQERLLFLEASEECAEITEHDLRQIAAGVYWNAQRMIWRALSADADRAQRKLP